MADRSEVRVHFHDQLAQLEVQALGALDIVIEQLDRAMEALEHQDVELATFVIADDDRVDGRYLEVHQGILSLLALQAPVATDLPNNNSSIAAIRLADGRIAVIGNPVNAAMSPDRRASLYDCLLYTSPSPRDRTRTRMPSSA